MPASDCILLNSWGATNASKTFADNLLGALNDDLDRDLDNPAITDVYQSGNDRLDSEMSQRRGIVIETKDKFIVEIREFRGFDVGIWQEDGRDILMQLYPPGGRAMFPHIECFKEALDASFMRVYNGMCEASINGYEHIEGHNQYLVHDPRRSGMDMVQIRLIGLYRHPEQFWLPSLIDVLKLTSSNLRDLIETKLQR